MGEPLRRQNLRTPNPEPRTPEPTLNTNREESTEKGERRLLDSGSIIES
jgi:hypothetical protein